MFCTALNASETKGFEASSGATSAAVRCDSREAVASCQNKLRQCTSQLRKHRLPVPADDLIKCDAESLCTAKVSPGLKACVMNISEKVLFGTIQFFKRGIRAGLGRGRLFETSDDQLAFREMVEANKEKIKNKCGLAPQARARRGHRRPKYFACRRQVLEESSMYNDEVLDGILRRYVDAVGMDSDCYNSAAVSKRVCGIFNKKVKLEGRELDSNISLGELRRVAELAKTAQTYADSKNRTPEDDMSFSDAKKALAEIKAEEERLGVEPKHQTEAFLMDPSKYKDGKAPITVVVYHGLFNSPDFSRWFAKHLHETHGINVINARVAGHYTGAKAGLDTVKRDQWVDQSQKLARIAGGTGEKTVYMGHSNGAILALHSAMGDLSNVGGVLLYSPAMKVLPEQVEKAAKAHRMGLSGWANNIKDRVKGAAAVLTGKKKETNLSKEQQQFASRYLSADASIESDKAAKELNGILAQQALLLGKTPEQFTGDLNVGLVETSTEDVVDLKVNSDLFVGTDKKRLLMVDKVAHRETLSNNTTATAEITEFSDRFIADLIRKMKTDL